MAGMVPLLLALSLTQILGWSTTFYIPATLGEAAMADTGLSRPVVFGGVTIMFMVGGLCAPPMGRLVDRNGARSVMMTGSVIVAAALSLMAFAHGLASWVASWVMIGVMMPMALANTAFVAVAQTALARGIPPRRPMAVMTLATGMAISAAFPLGAALQDGLGWRGACLAFAAINLFICLPLHASVPRGVPIARESAQGGDPGRVAPRDVTRVMALLALAFGLHGFCTVALELHLLTLLAAAKVGPALALSLAAASGPIRVAARLVDMAMARRMNAIASGLAAMSLMPLGLVCLMLGGPTAATAFLVLWSISLGVTSIARAALPLELFGPAGYGARLGKLTMPVHVGQGIGPMVFAALLDRFGAGAVMGLSLAFSCGALAALIGTARLVRRE
jgi:predicted MFS family arabinose efflux permease